MSEQAAPATTNEHKTLVGKLAEVMKAVQRIPKRGKNTQQNYTYATEADIADVVRDELANRGIVMIPNVEKWEWREIQGKNGPLSIITVAMQFTFTDGDASITYRMLGEGMDSGDKQTYKAQTGAEKYALLKFFLIPTGDDPEKDEPAEKGKKAAAAKPPEVKPADGPTIGKEKAVLWDSARKLWPNEVDHKARIRALLEKHGVKSTDMLPAGKEGVSAYVNELNEAKRIEGEAKVA